MQSTYRVGAVHVLIVPFIICIVIVVIVVVVVVVVRRPPSSMRPLVDLFG
jgi:quinol-cytochrome oxidoreductase complex cytochrome b subunit